MLRTEPWLLQPELSRFELEVGLSLQRNMRNQWKLRQLNVQTTYIFRCLQDGSGSHK